MLVTSDGRGPPATNVWPLRLAREQEATLRYSVTPRICGPGSQVHGSFFVFDAGELQGRHRYAAVASFSASSKPSTSVSRMKRMVIL